MATFGAEEDKAIAAQFDGEELVKSLGALSALESPRTSSTQSQNGSVENGARSSIKR